MYVCVGGSNDKYITNIEKAKCLFHLAGEEKTIQNAVSLVGQFASVWMIG